MTTWVFSKVHADAVRRDPNETELFKTEQSGEGEYSGTDALVRETIQNSLDAKHGAEPVRIRFALYPNSDLPANHRLSTYFSRLEPALEFRQIEFNLTGVPNLNNGFMVCEDFGTTGLSGDPYLVKDPTKGSTDKQDFYWFWRNIGRSGKTGVDLGRWGLGKTVYRAAKRSSKSITIRPMSTPQKASGVRVAITPELRSLSSPTTNYNAFAPNGNSPENPNPAYLS